MAIEVFEVSPLITSFTLPSKFFTHFGISSPLTLQMSRCLYSSLARIIVYHRIPPVFERVAFTHLNSDFFNCTIQPYFFRIFPFGRAFSKWRRDRSCEHVYSWQFISQRGNYARGVWCKVLELKELGLEGSWKGGLRERGKYSVWFGFRARGFEGHRAPCILGGALGKFEFLGL